MELDEIRLRIDGIDDRIISLLAERSEMVSAAGKLKKNEQGVRDPKRVGQVLQKVRAKAAGAGLDQDIAEEIYRTVIGCFVRKELKEFGARETGRKKVTPAVSIRKAEDQDGDQVMEIFNYHVVHGFAAYPEEPLDRGFFEFVKTIIYGGAFYVLETREKKIVGFGFLKKYHPYPAFNRTAEAGYFILPEFTRGGLGGLLLEMLEKDARTMGVDNLVANISSLNPASLEFHKKHGFRECGRFEKILTKFGLDLDIVWMQKKL
jgi:phosphinothricin acetyltransferase